MLRVDEDENWFGFVADSGSNDIVDENGVIELEVLLEGLSAERELGGLE